MPISTPTATTTLRPTIEGYAGLLFIGDVHANSRRPGRRLDDYAAACLDKVEQSLAIARAENLFPVFLGDLFHRPRENDLPLLTSLMALLRKSEMAPLLLRGSHDCTENRFTAADADVLLAHAGVLTLIDEPGLAARFLIGGQLVNLWATPAGYPLPVSVDGEGAARNIMITHHDLDFQGPYPGCHFITPVSSCDMVVNGHMHTPAPTVLKGGTAWHNPGSITRPSIDLIRHEPVVSIWTPAHKLSLEPVKLRINQNVFDLTGKEVWAADPRTLKASLPKGLRLSHFAARLREGEETLEAGRTDDGAVMVEEMQSYFELFETPDNVQRYLKGLLAEVVEGEVA